MAEDKSSTPEQQLLKLIEAQKGAPGRTPAPAASSGQAPVKRRGVSLAKLPGTILGALAFWNRKTKKKSFSRKSGFGISEVNKVMAFAIVLMFVYVVYDGIASATNLQKPPNFAPVKELRSPLKKDAILPMEESSYYLQKVSARDIFKEGAKEAPPVETAQVAVVERSAEAVDNLALVGISWSSNPDAIVEDKASQKTYFVKRGQMVGENVKVEAIFKDHVVVSFEDKEYELR